MTTEIIALFKKVLDKIADFFGILDLSFLISGILGIAAFLYGTWAVGYPMELPVATTDSWAELLASGVACYGTGLVMFALGRQLRRTTRLTWLLGRLEEVATPKGRADLIRAQIEAHGLPHGAYDLKDDTAAAAFYTRCWAMLRQDAELKNSYDLVQRYWVLAATYDGVAMGCLVWAVVLAIHAFRDFLSPLLEWWYGTLTPQTVDSAIGTFSGSFAILAGGLVLACLARPALAEAEKYQKYQINEVIATLAHKLVPLAPKA